MSEGVWDVLALTMFGLGWLVGILSAAYWHRLVETQTNIKENEPPSQAGDPDR